MRSLSSATLWIVIFLLLIFLFMNYSKADHPQNLQLLEWMDKGKNGLILSAVDKGGRIEGEYHPEAGSEVKKRYVTEYIEGQQEAVLGFVLERADSEHPIPYNPKPRNLIFQTLFLPMLFGFGLVFLFWMLLMRHLQGTGNKAMSFGKSKAKLVQEGQIKISFKDVAGVEEACRELQEIVEYLKDPKKFSRLGGRIPKGVLLVGPPGTGKTLLAKAIAGEANVPFFSISGSDFVEMFVGVGASRVRDLFDQAKKARPCIVFIDEIDAVGRSRFAGIGGSHDEREQTLNQLLVEMDGFAENEGVILISATNRPDVLDPALLRPGRFDRQVMVGLPDLRGREQILRVHAKKVKLAPNVDLGRIARGTPGFSGADLENLINEGALLAARGNQDEINMLNLEEAKDRVMMGPERRSLVISEKDKVVTAYHEAGHAVIARLMPNGDQVHKVTIIPRGPALGVTWVLPHEERHNYTRQQLINQLHYMYGGRCAEEIQFGEVTTGAQSDIDRATSTAYKMVCQFGMSEKLGPRAFGESSGGGYFGRESGRERNYSEETAAAIDSEVKELIDNAYTNSRRLLEENRDVLTRVAEALVERETIDSEEFELLFEGKPLPPPRQVTPTDSTPAPAEKETPSGERAKPRIDPFAGPRPQTSS